MKIGSKALLALILVAVFASAPCSDAQISQATQTVVLADRTYIETTPGEQTYFNIFVEYSYPAGMPSTSPTQIDIIVQPQENATEWIVAAVTPSTLFADCSSVSGETVGLTANCTIFVKSDAPADEMALLQIIVYAQPNAFQDQSSARLDVMIRTTPENADSSKTSEVSTSSDSDTKSTPGFEVAGLLCAIAMLAVAARNRKMH